jgi:hypothetical protein
MLDRLLFDHPASVGESYGEHARTASSVGLTLIAAGFACLAHAAIPALFKTRGSDTIRALNDHLVRKRGNDTVRNGGWVI